MSVTTAWATPKATSLNSTTLHHISTTETPDNFTTDLQTGRDYAIQGAIQLTAWETQRNHRGSNPTFLFDVRRKHYI